MQNHIDITLVLEQESIDLRLPTTIEVRRLIKELESIFKQPLTKGKYQLKVVNKGLLLDEGKTLNLYPIATGDVMTIVKGE